MSGGWWDPQEEAQKAVQWSKEKAEKATKAVEEGAEKVGVERLY